MRTTNNLGGDGDNKTSVKVHCAPGGKSNFSLGWGNEEAVPQKSSIRKYNNQSNIFGDDAPVKTPLEESKKECPTFGKTQNGRTTNNIGGDGNEKTSVRVHCAPGGNSSISFGTDAGPYDAPKKKENIKPQGRIDYSLYGATEPISQVKTSVKVHAPPGGKSSITFS